MCLYMHTGKLTLCAKFLGEWTEKESVSTYYQSLATDFSCLSSSLINLRLCSQPLSQGSSTGNE